MLSCEQSTSEILHSFDIKLFLTSGYLREINDRYVGKEIITLCTEYYSHNLPRFNTFHPSDVQVSFDNINSIISCKYYNRYNSTWETWWDEESSIIAITNDSWAKWIPTNEDYDYIFTDLR